MFHFLFCTIFFAYLTQLVNAATASNNASEPTVTTTQTPSIKSTFNPSASQPSAKPTLKVNYTQGYNSFAIFSTTNCTGIPYLSSNLYVSSCVKSGDTYSKTLIDPGFKNLLYCFYSLIF